jgi:hypothetical protein
MPGIGSLLASPRLIRLIIRCLVVIGVLFAVRGATAASPLDPLEDERLLKAVFIYNFAKFAHWPDDAWAAGETTLVLCVAGSDELAVTLERLAGQSVGGRSVVVRPYAEGPAGESCKLLYIAGSEHRHFAGLLEPVAPHPVLTISQIRGFADMGGMIQLYRDKDRVRFKINRAVVSASGLQLSARLLDLAELVGNGAAQ